MTMHRIANDFRDDLKPVWGIPTIDPQVGESFDKNNDLYLLDERTVLHRDGFITRGSPSSAVHDALIDYNRRHMTAEAFADYYGDPDAEERAELAMLHGDNA